jgi:hypothetical protein
MGSASVAASCLSSRAREACVQALAVCLLRSLTFTLTCGWRRPTSCKRGIRNERRASCKCATSGGAETGFVRETSSMRGTSTGTRNSCKRAVSVLHTPMGVKSLSAGIRGVHAEVGGKTCGSTGNHGSFDVNQEHRRSSCVAALSTHAWSNPMACTRLQLRRYTVSWICAKQRQLWKQLFACLKPRVAKSVACPAASCVGQ